MGGGRWDIGKEKMLHVSWSWVGVEVDETEDMPFVIIRSHGPLALIHGPDTPHVACLALSYLAVHILCQVSTRKASQMLRIKLRRSYARIR